MFGVGFAGQLVFAQASPLLLAGEIAPADLDDAKLHNGSNLGASGRASSFGVPASC
jgi:hypothetical protein